MIVKVKQLRKYNKSTPLLTEYHSQLHPSLLLFLIYNPVGLNSTNLYAVSSDLNHTNYMEFADITHALFIASVITCNACISHHTQITKFRVTHNTFQEANEFTPNFPYGAVARNYYGKMIPYTALQWLRDSCAFGDMCYPFLWP